MPDHDPANRRRSNQLDPLCGKLPRNRLTKRRCLLWKLKHERALQVDCAVQTARELEVTFEQRARRLELMYYFVSSQFLTSINMPVLQFEPECRLIPI